jgi:hypothetical protein
MKLTRINLAQEARFAKSLCRDLPKGALRTLEALMRQHDISLMNGDVTYLGNGWYVTHSGLLGIARRKRCVGIQVRPAVEFCDPAASRWAFEATVYKSRTCRGFVGYGDADPSNVSDLVHGADDRSPHVFLSPRKVRTFAPLRIYFQSQSPIHL